MYMSIVLRATSNISRNKQWKLALMSYQSQEHIKTISFVKNEILANHKSFKFQNIDQHYIEQLIWGLTLFGYIGLTKMHTINTRLPAYLTVPQRYCPLHSKQFCLQWDRKGYILRDRNTFSILSSVIAWPC